MKIYLNGAVREVPAGATAQTLVTTAGETEPRRGIAVAIDGTVVPRARLATTPLVEGARVEVVTAVQGG